MYYVRRMNCFAGGCNLRSSALSTLPEDHQKLLDSQIRELEQQRQAIAKVAADLNQQRIVRGQIVRNQQVEEDLMKLIQDDKKLQAEITNLKGQHHNVASIADAKRSAALAAGTLKTMHQLSRELKTVTSTVGTVEQIESMHQDVREAIDTKNALSDATSQLLGAPAHLTSMTEQLDRMGVSSELHAATLDEELNAMFNSMPEASLEVPVDVLPPAIYASTSSAAHAQPTLTPEALAQYAVPSGHTSLTSLSLSTVKPLKLSTQSRATYSSPPPPSSSSSGRTRQKGVAIASR